MDAQRSHAPNEKQSCSVFASLAHVSRYQCKQLDRNLAGRFDFFHFFVARRPVAGRRAPQTQR